MRFISWNVNGLRAVQKKGFEDIFWSLDADYDGHVHRAGEIIGGRDFCTLPEGSLHVIGYDVFGNRFCWEKIV